MSNGRKTIGVLAVQGAFARHAEVLGELGHAVRLLRQASDFEGLGGLVLPGGESTVQLQLIGRLGLEAPLLALARSRPVLATCAGVILLARSVTQPEQKSFGVLDVDVARNAWGRQLDSFEAESDEPLLEHGSGTAGAGATAASAPEAAIGDAEPLHLVFIRAPRIMRVGSGVEVLARFRGEPILVRQGNINGATFHPELSGDARVHAQVFGRVAP